MRTMASAPVIWLPAPVDPLITSPRVVDNRRKLGNEGEPGQSRRGDGGMTKATGGKAVYGAPLGILMLEARFRAFPATWAMR